MELKTIRVRDLKPGDGFVGEEQRPGRSPSHVPTMETVLRVTPCYSGTSIEYVCESGRLYFSRGDSEIDVWR